MPKKLIVKSTKKSLTLYENEQPIKRFIHLGQIKFNFQTKEIKSEKEFDDMVDLIYNRRIRTV